jgi:exopolyphosphatase / guanosine-5'-triphosphate,3'-diphosphate pyrophosphatase
MPQVINLGHTMAEKKAPGARNRRSATRNGKTAPLFAAVDLGTNNCRLLVAEPRGKTFRVVDSYSQIARLGEGLHETGRLSDAAIERAIDALQHIRRKLKQHGVGRVRCIATEACRKAGNGAEFIRRVHAETGLTFKIIGAKEEARLATIGCHDLIAPQARSVLVVDIGGGSTELSWVNAEAARDNGFKGLLEKAPILGWTSLPLGVVTLSEAFSHLDEVESYPLMVEHARQTLKTWDAIEQVRAAMSSDAAHMIGTSGTVTCLAGVHLKLDRYRRDKVDGTWLSQEESAAAVQLLRDVGLDGRSKLPTIGEERAGLMLSGCAIVEAVWEAFPAGRLRVADRGLREGLLLSMMYGPKKPKARRRNRRTRRGPDNQAGSQKDAPDVG